MKILVVSDSHGKTEKLKEVISKIKPIDFMIHLGDIEGDEELLEKMAGCETAMVSGNNDFFTTLEQEKMIQIGKYKILLTHGHKYKVNWGTNFIKEKGKEKGADIIMFGHTHIPCIEYGRDIIAVNPGSISLPRQEGHVPTYLIMDIDRLGDVHFTIRFAE